MQRFLPSLALPTKELGLLGTERCTQTLSIELEHVANQEGREWKRRDGGLDFGGEEERQAERLGEQRLYSCLKPSYGSYVM